MGFRCVSVKFGTFVCSYCKAGHQAFSHRIKSVGMSTFTVDEVVMARTLGNKHARAVWLGKLRSKDLRRQAPSPTSRPEEWHAWIKSIYLDKQFYKCSSHLPSLGTGPLGSPPPSLPKFPSLPKRAQSAPRSPNPPRRVTKICLAILLPRPAPSQRLHHHLAQTAVKRISLGTQSHQGSS